MWDSTPVCICRKFKNLVWKMAIAKKESEFDVSFSELYKLTCEWNEPLDLTYIILFWNSIPASIIYTWCVWTLAPAMCAWSPDGKKLAVAVKHRLVIRSSAHLKVTLHIKYFLWLSSIEENYRVCMHIDHERFSVRRQDWGTIVIYVCIQNLSSQCLRDEWCRVSNGVPTQTWYYVASSMQMAQSRQVAPSSLKFAGIII